MEFLLKNTNRGVEMPNLINGLRSVAAAAFLLGALGAVYPYSATASDLKGDGESHDVRHILDHHANNTCASCPAIRPLISHNPERAAELIATAEAQEPRYRDRLAYCLGTIYRGIRGSNPHGARHITALVERASPGFRNAFGSVIAHDAAAPDLCSEGSYVSAPVGPGTGVFGAGFGTFGGAGGGSVVSPTRP